MAYTTIKKPSDYFDTKIYTGNGSSQTLDMDNLGLLWMKNRTEASNHCLFDSVRGGYYTSAPNPMLSTNTTGGGNGSDITSAYGITFGSSSSTIGSDGGGYNYNQNSKSYVGWQWRANGTGSANTDGSITSTVSVNTTAGFSIVKYAGSNSNVTVGHGLGVAPKMILIKNLSSVTSWTVYHESIGNDKRLVLNTEGAQEGTNQFSFGTSPTSSVFALGGGYGDVCTSGADYIAYCFAEKTGYSKFGSYIGNGNANGPFIYTGFKPAFILSKKTNAAGTQWTIWDNKRSSSGFNPADKILHPNVSNPDNTADDTDFLSNGFKLRATASGMNNNGDTYIYMAIGQSIVGSNNVPAVAR